MKVQQIMSCDVECIQPDRTLQEAASRMKALDVGALPVCGNNRLEGMITDRDIVVRSIAEGHDPREERVGEVMTRELACCREDQNIEEAARLMNVKQIRRLAVINGNRQLVGILALADLAVGSSSPQLTGQTLQRISQPERPDGMTVKGTPY
jgi:CBS domain-containing protein